MSKTSNIDALHAELHCARSEVLDAFVTFENAIRFISDIAGIKEQADSLGNKIQKLRQTPASPSYSKERKAGVDELLGSSGTLVDERNAIVHSSMKFVQTCGLTEALFLNPKCDAAGRRIGYSYQLDSLRDVALRAIALANNLTDPRLEAATAAKLKSQSKKAA